MSVAVALLVLAAVFSVTTELAQRPAESGVSPTIAAKRPVFAGSCKACPRGIQARVTADALRFYG